MEYFSHKNLCKLFLLIVLMALLGASSYADESILNKRFKDSENFQINNVDYIIQYSPVSNNVIIRSKLNLLILNENSCEIKGYHKFCIAEITNKEHIENLQINLKVTKLDCIQYFDSEEGMLCKKEIGSLCETNKECVSSICCHGICTFKQPICGDGYCEDVENCPKDCLRSVKVVGLNPYTIEVDANKDWMDSHLQLAEGRQYSFDVEAEYFLDNSGKTYNPAEKENSSYTRPYPHLPFGALIGDICGEIYLINSSTVIKAENNCTLKLRINEETLIDNSGNLLVKVIEGEKVPEEIREKIISLMKKYVGYRNVNHYESIADLGVGKFAEYYSIHAEGQNDIRDITGAFYTLDSENIELESYEIKKEDGKYLAIANVKSKNMGDSITFHMIKVDDRIYIDNLEFLDTNISEIALSEINDNFDTKLNNIKNASSSNERNAPLANEGDSFWIPFILVILAIAIVIYSLNYIGTYPDRKNSKKKHHKKDLYSVSCPCCKNQFKVFLEQYETQCPKCKTMLELEDIYAEESEKEKKSLKIQKKRNVPTRKKSQGKESYVKFLENFKSKTINCQTWPDFVKAYIELYGNDTKHLKNLTKLIQEKFQSQNFNFVYKEIKDLFKKQIQEREPNILLDLREIDDMSGLDFEDYLRQMFQNLDYKVKKTKSTRDGGVDLILDKNGSLTLIQAKRYKITGMVGVDAVRDVYSANVSYRADKLIVLTTALKFSRDAIKQSEDLGVILWNRDKFKKLLRNSKLLKENYNKKNEKFSEVIGPNYTKGNKEEVEKRDSSSLIKETTRFKVTDDKKRCKFCNSFNIKLIDDSQITSSRRNPTIGYQCNDCGRSFREKI